jgi:hypothetical protein
LDCVHIYDSYIEFAAFLSTQSWGTRISFKQCQCLLEELWGFIEQIEQIEEMNKQGSMNDLI